LISTPELIRIGSPNNFVPPIRHTHEYWGTLSPPNYYGGAAPAFSCWVTMTIHSVTFGKNVIPLFFNINQESRQHTTCRPIIYTVSQKKVAFTFSTIISLNFNGI